MSEPLPELLSVQAQAVVDRAKALGLIWTLRPAAVQTSSSSAPTVIYDGDTEPVGAVTLIGNVLPDDRVMMLQVPPAGNFIIGKVGSPITNALAIPTLRGETLSTGDVTLTTASQNVGQAASLTISTPAQYIITIMADFDQTVSGGNNVAGATLQINGVGRSEQILFGVTAAGQRATLSKTYYGTLSPGTTTLQMVAVKSLNIGTFICRSQGTGFVYQIFQ